METEHLKYLYGWKIEPAGGKNGKNWFAKKGVYKISGMPYETLIQAIYAIETNL